MYVFVLEQCAFGAAPANSEALLMVGKQDCAQDGVGRKEIADPK